MCCVEAFLAGAALVFLGVGALEAHGEELSPVEQMKRDDSEGRIREHEFERRLDLHLDDRNEQIREVDSQVGNVDSQMSKDIAREFESRGELGRADREELTAIYGLCESIAALERPAWTGRHRRVLRPIPRIGRCGSRKTLISAHTNVVCQALPKLGMEF